MESHTFIHLLFTIFLIWIHTQEYVLCNPINFGTTSPPLVPIAPLPIPAPMLIGPQYEDPYSSLSQPTQFFLASPFGPMAFNTDRRSLPPRLFKQSNKSSGKALNDPIESEERKALEDLPLSFVSFTLNGFHLKKSNKSI